MKTPAWLWLVAFSGWMNVADASPQEGSRQPPPGSPSVTPSEAPQAPGQAAAPQATAPTGNAEQGRKLFTSYGCYQCHGYEAQGSSATGPRLGPRPMPYGAFSRYVRAPIGQMPPYTVKVLSDADLAHMYAFVQSRPAPQPVERIPLLNQ